MNSVQMTSGVTRAYVLDDSMITLRVAENFAHGNGPYFNAGEHTAANTSLFWPLFLSLRFHHGIDPSDAVLSLSQFSLLLCLVIMVVVATLAESDAAACLSLFLLAISPCFLEYGASVWEHIPQSLLVTLALCIYLGKIRRVRVWQEEAALLLLSLAFLIRPDTLPLLGVFLLVVLLKALRQRRGVSMASLGLCLLITGFYFALHHHFYGTFAPNTYYLKVKLGLASLKVGLHYVKGSAFECMVPLLVGYLAVFSLRSKGRPSVPESVVVASFVLQICYMVVVGGDVFPFGRFFVLLAPMTMLLFSEGLMRLTPRNYLQLAAAGVLLLLSAGSFLKFRASLADAQIVTAQGLVGKEDPQAAQASMVEFLEKKLSPQDGQIGLCWLGTLSYYMPQYQFADFLGKADAHIAHEEPKWGPVGHNKWDVEYSLMAHHISVIPIEPKEADYESATRILQSRRGFAFWSAIVADPYTRAHYTYLSPGELNMPSTWGLLVRNDLVAKLRPAVGG